MTPLEYLKKVGRKEADATATRAELSPGYFNQICYGHRRASPDAAARLVKNQHRSGRMTEMSILFHRVERKSKKRAALIMKAKSKASHGQRVAR